MGIGIGSRLRRQVLRMHAPNDCFPNRVKAALVPANTFFKRDMHEALQFKLVPVLFGKQSILTFVVRVEMGVVDDDFQSCLQCLGDKLRLPADDFALDDSTKLFRISSLFVRTAIVPPMFRPASLLFAHVVLPEAGRPRRKYRVLIWKEILPHWVPAS